VATVSEQDGRSVADPEIIFRGVPFIDDDTELVDALREAVIDSLARSAQEGVSEISLLQTHLHDDLAEFVYRRLKRRPMVLPVVVEV
jgi:ribonuclease J